MSNETKAGPYKLKEGNLVSGPNLPRYVANPISNAALCSLLNASYAAGQASREHSPDMVERVTRICKETLNAHGYDFPLDHDTPAMLDFRTHLASLFKPQP